MITSLLNGFFFCIVDFYVDSQVRTQFKTFLYGIPTLIYVGRDVTAAGRVAWTVLIADRLVSSSISKNRTPCSSHVAR